MKKRTNPNIYLFFELTHFTFPANTKARHKKRLRTETGRDLARTFEFITRASPAAPSNASRALGAKFSYKFAKLH